MRHPLLASVLMTCLAVTPALAQQHEHGAQPAERLGKVHFQTSCSAEVQPAFDRAVALLHSFWYAAAANAFQDVIKRDSSCAIAHWGIALSGWGNRSAGRVPPRRSRAVWPRSRRDAWRSRRRLASARTSTR